jgi:hypothetical protein
MAKSIGAVRFPDGQVSFCIWNGTVDMLRPRLFADENAASDAWDDKQLNDYHPAPGGEIVDVMPLYSGDNKSVFFRSRADRARMLIIGPLSLDRAVDEGLDSPYHCGNDSKD